MKYLVQMPVGYLAKTKQQTLDSGLNAFAIDLIAESYGDKIERFPEGAVLFTWPVDHGKRDLWFVITHEEPTIIEVPGDGEICPGKGAVQFRSGMIVEWAPCIRPAGHRGLCHAADPEQ